MIIIEWWLRAGIPLIIALFFIDILFRVWAYRSDRKMERDDHVKYYDNTTEEIHRKR